MNHPFLFVLVAMGFSVAGEFALKQGMNQVGIWEFSRGSFLPTLFRVGTNPFILLGLGLLGTGAVFWLGALSREALSWAYPLLSLSYVVVVLLSVLLFQEALHWSRLVGALVIVLGVFLVYRS